MSETAHWFFVKKGLVEDTQEGPVTESHLIALAADGKIKNDVLVMSRQATGGRWVALEKTNLPQRMVLQQREQRAREARDEVAERKRRAKAEESLRQVQAETAQRIAARQMHEQEKVRELYGKYRSRYKIVRAPFHQEEIERQMNYWGFEGWQLADFFEATEVSYNCCGQPESTQRVIWLVFTQPVEPKSE